MAKQKHDTCNKRMPCDEQRPATTTPIYTTSNHIDAAEGRSNTRNRHTRNNNNCEQQRWDSGDTQPTTKNKGKDEHDDHEEFGHKAEMDQGSMRHN